MGGVRARGTRFGGWSKEVALYIEALLGRRPDGLQLLLAHRAEPRGGEVVGCGDAWQALHVEAADALVAADHLAALAAPAAEPEPQAWLRQMVC